MSEMTVIYLAVAMSGVAAMVGWLSTRPEWQKVPPQGYRYLCTYHRGAAPWAPYGPTGTLAALVGAAFVAAPDAEVVRVAKGADGALLIEVFVSWRRVFGRHRRELQGALMARIDAVRPGHLPVSAELVWR